MSLLKATVQKLDDLKVVRKAWGFEYWVQEDGGEFAKFCQKLLAFAPGSAGSMHRHGKKSESFFITQGYGKIQIGRDLDGKVFDTYPLGPGDIVTLPRGVWHKVIANSDSILPLVLVEASTPHSDSDVERLDESTSKYVEAGPEEGVSEEG